MSKKNFMQVFADLHQGDLDNLTKVVQVAPLRTNLVGIDKKGSRCTVTIGVSEEVFQTMLHEPEKLIGGLILVDKVEYDKAKNG